MMKRGVAVIRSDIIMIIDVKHIGMVMMMRMQCNSAVELSYLSYLATRFWPVAGGKNRKTENIYFCHQCQWPFPSPQRPNLLKTGVGPSICCAELPLLFGGKKENRKICISVINGPSLPPKPSQTVKPPPNCQKSPWQECVSVNRSSYSIIGHLTFTVRRSLAQT